MPLTLHEIVPLLMLLSMGAALYFWLPIPRKNAVFLLFGVNLILALVLEITGYVLRGSGIQMGMVYSLFGLVEAWIVLTMILAIRPHWRIAIGAAMVFVTASIVVNYAFVGSFDLLLFEGILVNAVVLSLFLMVLLWSIAQTSVVPLVQLPDFWLFIGTLIYYSGMVPLFGLVSLIFDDDPVIGSALFQIAPGVTIIRYLLAAKACRMMARQPRAV